MNTQQPKTQNQHTNEEFLFFLFFFIGETFDLRKRKEYSVPVLNSKKKLLDFHPHISPPRKQQRYCFYSFCSSSFRKTNKLKKTFRRFNLSSSSFPVFSRRVLWSINFSSLHFFIYPVKLELAVGINK